MKCSFVSVQGGSSANACFCVYVSISVSIFPVSGLISVTRTERKEMTSFIFDFKNCHLYYVCWDFKLGITSVTHCFANFISHHVC